MNKQLNEGALRSELSGSAFFHPMTDSPANQLASEPTSQLQNQPPNQGTDGPSRTATSQLARKEVIQPNRKQEGPLHQIVPRVVEEHGYDIFHDQARWLNRVKLEVEENYGRRITANAIVQVALDKLRLEYEEKGEQSDLIQATIAGKSLIPEKRGRS